MGHVEKLSGSAPRAWIVAEIGNNHEGDVGVARDLVLAAADAGADAVKFQHFVPERYVASSEVERRKLLASFAISNDDLLSLFELASTVGLTAFATGFDIETTSWLTKHQSVIKIASGDNNFRDLISLAGMSGLRTIISLGLLSEAEVVSLYSDWVGSYQTQLTLLHCVSVYPAAASELNLLVIPRLRNLLPAAQIGYSDHSAGLTSALVAAAFGAQVIEKHFTLSHTHSDFRDHQLSATPDELKLLIRQIREVEVSLGNEVKSVTPGEALNRIGMRRSAAAIRDLPSGYCIQTVDIAFLRPGNGISPDRTNEIVGKTTIRPIKRGSIISKDDIDPR